MNKKVLLFLTFLLPLALSVAAGTGSRYSLQSSLRFTENVGQITDQHGTQRPDIQFRITGTGPILFLGPTGLHYQWNALSFSGSKKTPLLEALRDAHNTDFLMSSYRMDVSLLGANPAATVVKEEQEGWERYYLHGMDPLNNTAYQYKKITYKNVYPQIDWVLYIDEHNGASKLKYDFVVHPGGNAADIKIKYSGTSTLALQENGSLMAYTPSGTVQEKAPYAYSLSGNPGQAAQEVASRFVLENNILSFQTAAYQGTLVIDPELEWATYYGGDLFDVGACTLVDSQGNVYMTGAAMSATNIATVGAHQTTIGGGVFSADGFIAKFTAAGTRLWATYYGGDKNEVAYGAALDPAGNVYLSGQAPSTTGIATPGSYQPTLNVKNDVFLAKFNADGRLSWGTYFGGPDNENGGLIATDRDCNIYMVGYTKSTSVIATPGSFKPTFSDKTEDAFLVKFDSSGQRKWATYFGGTGKDYGGGIACDTAGFVYISGYTQSTTGIATSNSYQSTLAGKNDLFLAKFNGTGEQIWSTYYGGPEDDNYPVVSTLTTDLSGNVYMAGTTKSTTDIASSDGHQTTLGGSTDAFLVKFNTEGQREWGTYYGGLEQDGPGKVSVDGQGNILWIGITKSSDAIASPGSFQPTFGGGADFDAFIVKLNKNGQRQWGSYLGGPSNNEGTGITVDKWGNIYATGNTGAGFPVTEGSHQDSIFASISNAFLARFCGAALPSEVTINGNDSICPDMPATYAIATIEGATEYIWTIPEGWTGTSDSASITVQPGRAEGLISVQIVKCNDTSNVISRSVGVYDPLPAVITIEGFTLRTMNTHSSYQWILNDELIENATGKEYRVTQNGVYKVITTDEKGCIDTSDGYLVQNVGILQPYTNHSLSVYPNPANKTIHIQYIAPVNVAVIDMNGRTVLQQDNTSLLDISTLPESMYLLRIYDAGNTIIKQEKIVIQH